MLKTIFQFVEPNESNEYTSIEIIPTDDDLETVKKQITETWAKIQHHDFYTGCGKQDCNWCNFVKETNQFIALKEMVELNEDEI